MTSAVKHYFLDKSMNMPVYEKREGEFWALRNTSSSSSSFAQQAADSQNYFPRAIITPTKKIVLKNLKISDSDVPEFRGCHLEVINPYNALIRGKRGGVVGGLYLCPEGGGKQAVIAHKKVTEQFFKKVNSSFMSKSELLAMRSAIKA
jgi:hypothetical protein